MSHPSFPTQIPLRPAVAAAASPAAALTGKIPWGWLEWFAISQTFVPALVFIPGIAPVRSIIRIASFVVALVAWISIVVLGRPRPGAETFPAYFWLKLASFWLLLMIIHPSGNSLQAGVAQVMLYIAVFSPVFWAPGALQSPRQVGRVMAILLVCNGISALVGLGQVFRPGTFNPPVINFPTKQVDSSNKDELEATEQYYDTGNGSKILRPCGLTDGPGGAAPAASIAALLGMAFALRPIGIFKRLCSLGIAFVGVAVIYYTQVRSNLIMVIMCWGVLAAVFAATKHYAQATMISVLGAGLILGAFSWVVATSGSAVVERFLGLTTTSFGENLAKSGRSGFLQEAFERLIWEYPLGAGLGWWGTINGAFGDKSTPSNIWVETMIPAWIIDGGIPLLLLSFAAIFFAMTDTLRIAFRSRDRDLSYWAAVTFASNLSILALCVSYVPFVMVAGIQFWMLSAVIHAADARVQAMPEPARKPAPQRPPAPQPRIRPRV